MSDTAVKRMRFMLFLLTWSQAKTQDESKNTRHAQVWKNWAEILKGEQMLTQL